MRARSDLLAKPAGAVAPEARRPYVRPQMVNIMASRTFGLFALTVGFIATVASTSGAAERTGRHFAQNSAIGVSSRCQGGHKFACGPVYNAHDYLGDDPDPFIRAMIQRDLGAKYGGSE